MRTRHLDQTRIIWLAAMLLLLGAELFFTAGCGPLRNIASIIQPPRFEQDARPAELRFITPSLSHPTGGAGVTLWIRVTNPNPFGFTLSTLDTRLTLEGSRAATGDFPLGLPLTAGETTTVPIDLSISFADVPGLATALGQAATGSAVAYQLDGTVGVDAGRFGQPTFGPMMLASGELGVRIARQLRDALLGAASVELRTGRRLAPSVSRPWLDRIRERMRSENSTGFALRSTSFVAEAIRSAPRSGGG